MGCLARGGVAAIAAYGEGGGNLDGAVRRVGENSGGDAVILYEACGFPTHAKFEAGVLCGFAMQGS